MSPSTSTPQDAFKGAKRPGWWTCFLCNVRNRGGQAAYYAHYNRVHYREVKP